jgi:2-polyprenyl-6-methoxyphenol hydroxylase-like FAD-dependent oxidoreductase
MTEHVIVLGGDSTGTAFAAALRRLDEGVRITMIERGLVGGDTIQPYPTFSEAVFFAVCDLPI